MNTFEVSGAGTGVDRSADNSTVENQFAAPVESDLFLAFDIYLQLFAVDLEFRWFGHPFLVRFDYEPYFAELSGSARLFFVPVIGCGHFRDRFAERNFRCEVLHLHFIDVGQLPFEDVEVVFALPLQDDLFELLGVLHEDGRILEIGAVEQFAQFFVFARFDGFDRYAVTRFREANRIDFDVRTGCRKGLVRAGAFEFDGAADIARPSFQSLLHGFCLPRRIVARSSLCCPFSS